MVGFFRGKMQRRVQAGFSIILPASDAVRKFEERIKLSRITALPQTKHQPRFILNLSLQPEKGTPSVNGNTDREITPELMQLGK